jgi:hypothetical protein
MQRGLKILVLETELAGDWKEAASGNHSVLDCKGKG